MVVAEQGQEDLRLRRPADRVVQAYRVKQIFIQQTPWLANFYQGSVRGLIEPGGECDREVLISLKYLF
jgi:hypothetical protein